MKAKSFAVLALVAGGLFLGSTAAMAEDIDVLPKPVCAENEHIEYTEDGGYFCVNDLVAYSEVTDTPPVDPVDGCWTTEDGTDVCARGFVTDETPQPIDENCSTVTNDDGTESFVCADWMATTGTPVDGGVNNFDGVVYDDNAILEKAYTLNAAGSTEDGTLTFLGLFFGLLGGAAILLAKKPMTK